MISTFICEWDTEKLSTLVVASETLRAKAIEVRKMATRLALNQYDKDCEEEE